MKLYHAHGAENDYRSETLTHRGRYKHREGSDTECAKNAVKRNGKQNGKKWRGERRDDEINLRLINVEAQPEPPKGGGETDEL